MSADRQALQLIDQICRSKIYRDYERAFREITGLALVFCPVDTLSLPQPRDPNQAQFCELVNKGKLTCVSCREIRREEATGSERKSVGGRSFPGYAESAVPVYVGQRLLGFLQAGDGADGIDSPSCENLRDDASRLAPFEMTTDARPYDKTILAERGVGRKQHKAILQLLAVFAHHLSELSNRIVVREASIDFPAITQAKKFIAKHYGDELTLGDVAKHVSMSTYYFCKSFHKATGLTFTDYLARVRVEKVKDMLLDPNKRVSEAAYDAGFQSLSQFNRVFRRVAGESPSDYRAKNSQVAGDDQRAVAE